MDRQLDVAHLAHDAASEHLLDNMLNYVVFFFGRLLFDGSYHRLLRRLHLDGRHDL